MQKDKKSRRISDPMARRLPMYYRQLCDIEKEGAVDISSFELAKRMDLTDSQIRHDLNAFGGFGRRGLGYNVQLLKKSIGDILDINRERTMIIVGAGNIGRAVALYPGFSQSGFHVTALFDVDPEMVDRKLGNIPVYHAKELAGYLSCHAVEIAVLATPSSAAQETLDVLAAARVPGVWNFVPVTLSAPEGMIVYDVHLTDSLMVLSFRMHEQQVHRENKDWTE